MQHEEVQVINSKLDLVSHLNGVMFIDQSQNEIKLQKNNLSFITYDIHLKNMIYYSAVKGSLTIVKPLFNHC